MQEYSEKEVGKLIWNSKSKAIAYSMRCEDEGKEIYSPDVLDPVVKENIRTLIKRMNKIRNKEKEGLFCGILLRIIEF